MPESVHSTQLTVHRSKRTVNHESLTVNKRQRRLGFSLIELLVAITILGILASMVTYTMIGQQRKARDAQRKSDMQTFKKAMEAAKVDCRNAAYYPRLPGTITSEKVSFFLNAMDYLTDPDLKYLPSRINDPQFDINNYTDAPSYRLAIGNPATDNHCQDDNTPPTSNNWAATETWVARAKLEITNDPDINKTRLTCQNAIDTINDSTDNTDGKFDSGYEPAANDGFYYVCSS